MNRNSLFHRHELKTNQFKEKHLNKTIFDRYQNETKRIKEYYNKKNYISVSET